MNSRDVWREYERGYVAACVQAHGCFTDNDRVALRETLREMEAWRGAGRAAGGSAYMDELGAGLLQAETEER